MEKDREEKLIKDAIKELLSNFNNGDSKYTLNYQYIFTDNLFNKTIENCDEEELKEYNQYDDQLIEMYNSYNGFTLFPNNKHSNFIISINKKMIDSNNNYLHTFIHELTHVFDYTRFMTDNNLKTKTEILNHNKYHYIYFWSEYHARYIGYKYYSDYMIPSKEDQLNNIIDDDFPAHMDYLKNTLKNSQLSFEQLLVSVCYEYGRFKYYKELGFNAVEDERFIIQELLDTFGRYVFELYKIFIETKEYNDFEVKFKKIEFCINQISHEFYNLKSI